jgi:hypothetical protein
VREAALSEGCEWGVGVGFQIGSSRLGLQLVVPLLDPVQTSLEKLDRLNLDLVRLTIFGFGVQVAKTEHLFISSYHSLRAERLTTRRKI